MSFRAAYLHSGSVDPNKAIGWKQDKKVGGGGVLFDLGSHALDIIYFLLGEIRLHFCQDRDHLSPRDPDKTGKLVDIEADDVAFMIAKDEKRRNRDHRGLQRSPPGANDELRFEIHGDKGAIPLQPDGSELAGLL